MSENQGIPDKEPTRDEVRATLTSHADEYVAAKLPGFRAAATPEQLLGIVMGWQPIETAPRDNARPLLLAQFDETGTLVTADYNGEWADTTGRWAFPQGFCWVSENGHAGQPTHWLPQPEWFTQLPREAPGEG